MTPAANLAALFTRKWRPAEEPAAAEFSRELDELRAAEFLAARQTMARELIATVSSTCAALASMKPEFQPQPFRALGPWSTKTLEEIRALTSGFKAKLGTTIQTFHCSLCGGEFSTPEAAAGHECPTAREIEEHHAKSPEPATNINIGRPNHPEPV